MTQESGISFASYGKDFQEKIVQGLLTDRMWAEQMAEVIDTQFFDLKYLRFLADRYFTYHQKYKDFPSLQTRKKLISKKYLSMPLHTQREKLRSTER